MLKRQLRVENDGGISDSSSEEEVSHVKKNTKVLLLSSRGVNQRQRHLLLDLLNLLPHSKKDAKFDNKNNITDLNELAELHNCDYVMYFEIRKRDDCYLWLSKTPEGPSAKFLVFNVHTLDELNMTGNCIKGTRALLSFDATFDAHPHWTIVKDLLQNTFGTAKNHRKSKPYYDHIFNFTIADNRIWFRNYQIVEKDVEGKTEVSLVEIGPRFVLDLIRIFEKSFMGSTLFENEQFISPNTIRSEAKAKFANKYKQRSVANEVKQQRTDEAVLPDNELNHVFD